MTKKVYEIIVEESLSKIVKVPATSKLEAEEIARRMWNDGSIILDSNDFDEVKFTSLI